MDPQSDDLVSIVIPTYNRAWGLAPAIESALAQTYPRIEVVITDDFSRDNTAEVARSYADPRIRYSRQPQNVGMVANWGEGLRRAQGRYFVFLCDDDQLRPEFVAHRVPSLAGDDRVVAAFSQYDLQDRDGNRLSTLNANRTAVEHLEAEDLLRIVLDRTWFGGASLYRKSAVEAVWPRGQQDNLVLDFGLNLRLAVSPGARAVFLPENDFIMLSHEEQNTNARLWKVLSETNDLLERVLREEKLMPGQARLIRRELALWNVLWGRKHAARHELREARRRLNYALRIDPGAGWAWRQALQSWLTPRRFMDSAE